MLVGSNPEEAHPVFGMQIRAGRRERREAHRGRSARHLALPSTPTSISSCVPAPTSPSPTAWCTSFIEKGLVDREFIEQRTEGFEELARDRARTTRPSGWPKSAASIADDLVAAAELYASAKTRPDHLLPGRDRALDRHRGRHVAFEPRHAARASSAAPAAASTPSAGRTTCRAPATWARSPSTSPATRSSTQPRGQGEVREGLGRRLAQGARHHRHRMLPRHAIEGKIKGLFIFGEDPVRTDADTHHIIRALESLEFLVVDDLFLTETAKYADVVLPGRSYAEKEGTFTNTERRVQRVRKAVEVAGDDASSTPRSSREIMNRMGYAQPDLTSRPDHGRDCLGHPVVRAASATRASTARRSTATACSGHAPAPDHPGTPIMHVGEFARGTGSVLRRRVPPVHGAARRRVPARAHHRPHPQPVQRLRDDGHAPEGHERDRRARPSSRSTPRTRSSAGIADGDRVRVCVAARADRVRPARVSGKTCAGETWMPFHFQDGNSNWLTNPALDEYQPRAGIQGLRHPGGKALAVSRTARLSKPHVTREGHVPSAVACGFSLAHASRRRHRDGNAVPADASGAAHA